LVGIRTTLVLLKMGEIRNYRDLIVWQKAITFVSDLYKTTDSFPAKEMYGITNQLRRASVSIPSNIAEGYGRNSIAEYKRFCQISLGSLYEVQTLLEVSFNLSFLSEVQFAKAFADTREIERMLTSLIRKLGALRIDQH
jgi:four helix bundle protein